MQFPRPDEVEQLRLDALLKIVYDEILKRFVKGQTLEMRTKSRYTNEVVRDAIETLRAANWHVRVLRRTLAKSTFHNGVNNLVWYILDNGEPEIGPRRGEELGKNVVEEIIA